VFITFSDNVFDNSGEVIFFKESIFSDDFPSLFVKENNRWFVGEF